MVEDGEFQPVVAMADHFLAKNRAKFRNVERERTDGFDEIECWGV